MAGDIGGPGDGPVPKFKGRGLPIHLSPQHLEKNFYWKRSKVQPERNVSF